MAYEICLPIGRNFLFVSDDHGLELSVGQVYAADLGHMFGDVGHRGRMLRAFGNDLVQILDARVEPFGLRTRHGGRVVLKVGGGGLGARLDLFGRLDRSLFLYGGAEEQFGQLAVMVTIIFAQALLVGFFVLDLLLDQGILLGALLLVGLELKNDLFFGVFVILAAAGLTAEFGQELTLFGDRLVESLDLFLIFLDLASGGFLGRIAKRLTANDVVG